MNQADRTAVNRLAPGRVGVVRHDLASLVDRLRALVSTDTDDFTRYQLEEALQSLQSAGAYLSEAQYDLERLEHNGADAA